MEKERDFDIWNSQKKKIDLQTIRQMFQERDIWFCSLGTNIGFEQNGTGDAFHRPMVIIKKFNNDIFLGVPITTSPRNGPYYFSFYLKDWGENKAITSQVRLIDAKRLINKIGVISLDDFALLKEKIRQFFV